MNEESGSITINDRRERWASYVTNTLNDIDLAIYNTGNLPDFSKLTELSRDEWDKLVNQFINSPAMNQHNSAILILSSLVALMTQENSKMQREEL